MKITSLIPGLQKSSKFKFNIFHTSQCVEKCWFWLWKFFQAWNQAYLTKNRHMSAILGLQISTDYKDIQHNSKSSMFFLIMNINICDIRIQIFIFSLFGRSWKWLDLKTLLCSWSETLAYVNNFATLKPQEMNTFFHIWGPIWGPFVHVNTRQ